MIKIFMILKIKLLKTEIIAPCFNSLKNLILNIQYIDKNSKSVLADNLKLKKDKLFFKVYKFSPPF